MTIIPSARTPHSPLLSDTGSSLGRMVSESQGFNISTNQYLDQKSLLTRFCIICGVVAALTSFIAGYKLAELNNPKDSIMSCNLEDETAWFGLPLCLPMSEVYFGLVTSILAIGGLIGSMFSSRLADTYGRRKSLIFNSVVLFVGSTFETFAYSPFMLLLGRFISGIGAGIGFVIVPMYLTEIAPIESRGLLNIFSALGVTSGIFISQLMGHLLNINHGWRIVLGAGIFLSLFSGIFLFYIVESPRYLYGNNQEKESKFSLRKLRGKHNVEDEFRSWNHESRQNESVRNESVQNEDEPHSYLNSNIEQNEYLHEFDGTEQKLNLISIFGFREYRHPIILKAALFFYDIYVCELRFVYSVFDIQTQLYVGHINIPCYHVVCARVGAVAFSTCYRNF
ncbi:putative metabolite transport protein [Smittium mucronatum]|uniref:Putative metabolite transport protein n=1 Tax=Smittium mucronatum TaxID=133383 RepID=A0A1R0H8Q3_9FUNG|nr:putative metabolite transport protein [Smittium mucronatum]